MSEEKNKGKKNNRTRRGGGTNSNRNTYTNNTSIKKRKKDTHNFTDEEIEKMRANLPEIDYVLDGSVKQLFLNLTKMQITFGKEETLESLLPDNLEKDEHGNYFLQIGDSKTMFCAHLDTYSHEYKRVYHKIEDNIISTDGTTTLGGDDKAGVVIIIKMIEANIPGLYYFFRGEEGVTSPTGTWGSRQALKSYRDKFKKYKKCIAFDRKGNNSIITSQMHNNSCSTDFLKELKTKFANNGLEYKEDSTGMWCDSGVFMEIIPECTNISVGYKNEHTFSETQDIVHLEKLVEVCITINWDELPVKRNPKETVKRTGRYYYTNNWDQNYYNSTESTRSNYYTNPIKKSKSTREKEYITMDQMFDHVVKMLEDIDFESMNGENDFDETAEMYFMNNYNNEFLALKIIDFDIYLSDDDKLKSYSLIGDLDAFEAFILSELPEESELDSESNRHLDSIAREGEKKYSYTKTVEKIFKEFTQDVPSMALIIIDECGDKAKRIPPDMFTKVKLEMHSYGFDGLDVDPHDYTDWIYDNKNLVNRLLEETQSKNIKKTNTIDIFKILIKKSPQFTKVIINELEKERLAVISSVLWIRIDEFIKDSGYISDYDESDISLNADDFVEWIFDNIKTVNDMIKDKLEPEHIKLPESENINDLTFLNVVSAIKINSDYTAGENRIFSKIVDVEEELVTLVITDIEIHTRPEVRDTTLDKIKDILIHKYDTKDSDYNATEFVHWISDFKKYIKHFYID